MGIGGVSDCSTRSQFQRLRFHTRAVFWNLEACRANTLTHIHARQSGRPVGSKNCLSLKMRACWHDRRSSHNACHVMCCSSLSRHLCARLRILIAAVSLMGIGGVSNCSTRSQFQRLRFHTRAVFWNLEACRANTLTHVLKMGACWHVRPNSTNACHVLRKFVLGISVQGRMASITTHLRRCVPGIATFDSRARESP